MKTIRHYLPPGIWINLKRVLYFPKDVLQTFVGGRHPLTPPEGLNFIGSGNFEAIGLEFFGYFRRYADLKPEAKVLDIGCGLGRMAVPLTDFLKVPGSYDGVDIVHQGIDWCTENISKRYPHFRFHHSDIYNLEYNPKGQYKASEYQFPFANESFDFIFLASVFTHMLQPDIRNYVNEIGRLLKPEGKCLATYYLLNTESLRAIEAGKSRLHFRHEKGGGWAENARNPEYAIAYSEELVETIFAEGGLCLEKPIHFGSWCGRTESLSHQDICLASKRS